ncbi:MAG: 16S rRNA (adenine(1518)-N(6)/adenine(1519)-N(6))-dimethyltransferase RsmA [Gammaproteobacteria bacterium]|nr:MAG: 16S rRNA (adenine(1518)-N(6)/adenine(1519)-N(6))-dimethyltransferase RsmA [Gammaproteobacteria bacterium]
MTRPLRKRFGQHLLTNPNTINNIVKVIYPKNNDKLVEIGPGRGAITIPILKSIGQLHAIEIDSDIAHEVSENCKAIGDLIIHQGDVLNFDFNEVANSSSPIRLFGNLPYNISTPLLFHLLKFSDLIIDMHFMLQKEVVDRIIASAGDSNYSRLSIMIQCSYKVESLFDISPNEFSPPPKVNSSFMRLTPSDEYSKQIKDLLAFSKLVETAFQQRRKTIKNSLSNLATEEQLTNANIKTSLRPQDISIPQYIKLSNELAA